ncbi:hypothetical protein bcere0025_27930 [Bacillus cereus F65185]|nr:hypothetical protein bcere0025_27930 [Bacillus cereus F65185]
MLDSFSPASPDVIPPFKNIMYEIRESFPIFAVRKMSGAFY